MLVYACCIHAVTCESGRESRAGTEAVALLSEQYERMTASSGDVEAQARPSSGGAVDIAAAIAEEIEELRASADR